MRDFIFVFNVSNENQNKYKNAKFWNVRILNCVANYCWQKKG